MLDVAFEITRVYYYFTMYKVKQIFIDIIYIIQIISTNAYVLIPCAFS